MHAAVHIDGYFQNFGNRWRTGFGVQSADRVSATHATKPIIFNKREIVKQI